MVCDCSKTPGCIRFISSLLQYRTCRLYSIGLHCRFCEPKCKQILMKTIQLPLPVTPYYFERVLFVWVMIGLSTDSVDEWLIVANRLPVVRVWVSYCHSLQPIQLVLSTNLQTSSTVLKLFICNLKFSIESWSPISVHHRTLSAECAASDCSLKSFEIQTVKQSSQIEVRWVSLVEQLKPSATPFITERSRVFKNRLKATSKWIQTHHPSSLWMYVGWAFRIFEFCFSSINCSISCSLFDSDSLFWIRIQKMQSANSNRLHLLSLFRRRSNRKGRAPPATTMHRTIRRSRICRRRWTRSRRSWRRT